MKRYLTIGLAVLALAGLSPAIFAGNSDWRAGNRRDGDWRQYRRNRDHNETIVISGDNNDNGCNYNNANYLGYPPWYRLNYYTPWMSDYRDGTAWTRIPTSHAAESYGMPSSYNTMPSGYYNWLAANGAANAPEPYPGTGYASSYAPPPAMSLAGNDIVVVVQRELRRRGFYQGIINGLSDSATRAAIRGYETSAGLPTTGGIISIELLRSLGLL